MWTNKKNICWTTGFLHFSHEVFYLTSKLMGSPENTQTLEMPLNRTTSAIPFRENSLRIVANNLHCWVQKLVPYMWDREKKPQNQIDSSSCFNGDNGVKFFPSWTFSTRRPLWWWAKTYLFLQWQERNSKPSLIMKTPNGKQVQPDYNLRSEVYLSFLIIGKKTQQQCTLHLLC